MTEDSAPHDQEPSLVRLARETVLSWGPAILGLGIWAAATFPEKLEWTSELSARFFGLVAAFYDHWTEVEGYGEALEQALLDLRGSPRRVCDVATGTGYAAVRLKSRYPSAEVTGVDVSPEMVGLAQHNAVAAGVEVDFEVADAARLPYEDGAFDLVVLQNALPFPDELMRMVAPGGKALLVYSFAGPWVSLAWPALARRLEKAGASHTSGKRAGLGYVGVARKPGARRPRTRAGS